MDDHHTRPLHVHRALRQRLEGLARAGVQQLPRIPAASAAQSRVAARPAAPPPPAAAPEPVAAGAPDAEPLALSELAAPRHEPVLEETLARRTKVSDKQQQLTTLCQQVAACRLCPELVAHRTQTVFGVGNPQARLCFFGEAPGADEDRQGEPFVGRAGQLLNKIIEACSLTRSEVYILNTVKCRPPGNRNPSPEEIERCRPFYLQQLEIIQPEFICCLGLVAAAALLETKLSIGRLRGTLHPWNGAQVLVTYHPAYLLRNPPAKRLVWEDMKFLMGEMGIQR